MPLKKALKKLFSKNYKKKIFLRVLRTDEILNSGKVKVTIFLLVIR